MNKSDLISYQGRQNVDVNYSHSLLTLHVNLQGSATTSPFFVSPGEPHYVTRMFDADHQVLNDKFLMVRTSPILSGQLLEDMIIVGWPKLHNMQSSPCMIMVLIRNGSLLPY